MHNKKDIATINKVNGTTEAQPFHSSNHHKWPPSYQIIGGKNVKNVQIGPQTTEIWPKLLKVPKVTV